VDDTGNVREIEYGASRRGFEPVGPGINVPPPTLTGNSITGNENEPEDDGQYRAMLIDFGLFRYSTPVVDLSTYLCLCCSNEIRKDKFSEIMRVYHDALKEYLLEAGVWDIKKYSYEALLDDFERGGLFGYVIASFYLPVLLEYYQADVIQNILSVGISESMKQLKYNDEFSKILADMLLNLRDLGCLKHIL